MRTLRSVSMRTLRSVSLWCNEGSSDKVYDIQLNEHEEEFTEEIAGGQESAQLTYRVEAQSGRRGASLVPWTKTADGGVSYEKALKVFESLLNSKLAKGYEAIQWDNGVAPEALHTRPAPGVSGMATALRTETPPAPVTPPNTEPARHVHRRKIFWDNPDATPVTPCKPVTPITSTPVPETQAMSPGEKIQTGNYPQLLNEIDEETAERLLDDPDWGLQEKKDGTHKMLEWKRKALSIGEGVFEPGLWVTNKKGILVTASPSFIHSVIPVLEDWSLRNTHLLLDGEQIGDNFHVFDIHEEFITDLRGYDYNNRYIELRRLFASSQSGIILVPLYVGTDKRFMYEQFKREKREGVVFKKLTARVSAGRPSTGGDMLKHKFYAELSARVCAGRPGKNSIGLELLNQQGTWEFRGYCTVAASKMPIPIGSIAEIKYLYVNGQHGHLYQPSFKEIRDDVDPSECTTAQIKFKREEE
jgi:bifunctional non-homologous end joining protein LigD